MNLRSVLQGCIACALLVGGPLAAGAQMTPPYPPPAAPPPGTEARERYDQTHVVGEISAIQGLSLQLSNGRVVFLHHGTVINPTGTKLQPGMRIAVLGSPSGTDAIDANEIDVGPRLDAEPGAGISDRYHATHAYGTIASVQGSSLQLDSGRVIFMHPGTVIAPTGTTLQPGMRIDVLGTPASNDAITANVVTVAGTSATGQ
ncbi:MAG: hypothetical protein JO101_09450 [Candidatus Eremiobacteraeota bacterium]|nr:hypothetical protein [Candidatus Eremiobacteraeota bacterium]MBV8355533.1 hypothetical protein [Candidatus Eremiobacteraeota bacterium]